MGCLRRRISPFFMSSRHTGNKIASVHDSKFPLSSSEAPTADAIAMGSSYVEVFGFEGRPDWGATRDSVLEAPMLCPAVSRSDDGHPRGQKINFWPFLFLSFMLAETSVVAAAATTCSVRVTIQSSRVSSTSSSEEVKYGSNELLARAGIPPV